MIIIKFKYFLSGILFISFIMPFLEELLSLILTFIEWYKGKTTLKITKINNQIQKLSGELDGELSSNPIGFVIPTEEDDDDEEL